MLKVRSRTIKNEVDADTQISINVGRFRQVVGTDGLSAYAIAVLEGFVGSEDAWLESLKGAKGDEGKSAYEVAVDNGYVGSVTDWIESNKPEISNKAENLITLETDGLYATLDNPQTIQSWITTFNSKLT